MAATGDKLRALNENENFVLGVGTGVIEQAMSQPLLYWKNAYQQGLPFTMNPRFVYRGTFAACTNMGAVCGVQFISSGIYQKFITGDARAKMTWSQEVLCAFLGGATSGPVCSALELIMIQQQRFGGTFVGTPLRIVRLHGVMALTRGVFCTSGREALYTAGYLGSVPATQKYVREHMSIDPRLGNFVGTVGAGLLCAAISQPLDTAKTCMQGDIERKKYGTLFQTLQTLKSEYGSISAMYRGYAWRAVYVIFDFIVLDFLAKNLAPIMYPDKFK